MSSGRTRGIAVAAGTLTLAAAFLGLRAPAPAATFQHEPPSVGVGQADPTRFLAEARATATRYDSLQHAIDDGFKRVGTEFPAMGEHWVSFARVLEDSLDARRPSVLIYVNTVVGPRLAGVAYSRLIGGSAAPPAFPFIGAWHEHNGAVSDESLPAGHSAHAPATPDARLPDDSLRFFILHAWIRAANPAGPFATDNWTLPMMRLGLDPGLPLPRDAVRGLALAADEDDYHHAVLSTALALTGSDDSVVAAVVRSRRARIGDELAHVRHDHGISPARAGLLGAAWDSLWIDLRRAFPSREMELKRLREVM